MSNENSIFQLDTKGTCLLCFSNCGSRDGSLPPRTPAFKMLLRYLKIDLTKLGHLSSAFVSFLSGPDSVNISVNLCQHCSSVTTDFLQLFQDFERLRMKLDNCAQELYQAMDEGANDDVRVREYRNRVGPLLAEWMRPEDVLHSNIADNLRKETMEKCAQRVVHSIPRILIEDELSPKTQNIMPSTVCWNTKINAKENLVNIMNSETPIPSTSTQADVDFLQLEECADVVDDNPSLQMQDPLEMCNTSFEGSNSGLEFETPSQEFNERDKKVKNRKSLKDLKKSSGNTTHKCLHCDKTFPWITSLRSHLMMIHTFLHFSKHKRLPPGTTEQQLQSSIQDLLSKTRQLRNTDSGKLSYGCMLCNKSFLVPHKLQRHVLCVHFDVLVKNYLTNDVPFLEQSQNDVIKKEKTNETLALNIFENDSETECNSLLTKDPLEPELDADPDQGTQLAQSTPYADNGGASHKDNPGELECHHCRKVFSHIYSLESHNKHFHSGVIKHYRCVHCTKVFTREYALKVHETEHTFTIFYNRFPPGTTAFEFNRVVNKVLSQMKKHCVAEKARCPFCEKTFKSSHKAHILLRHLDNIVDIIKQEKLEGR